MLTEYFRKCHEDEKARSYFYYKFPEHYGPQSFEDLLTIDKHRCSSFKEVEIRRGLLESDQSVIEFLNEAIVYEIPYALRSLFATILVWCEPTDVRNLWDSYCDALSEDFRWYKHMRTKITNNALIERNTLKRIKSLLESMGKKLSDYNLPNIPVEYDEESETYSKEILDEMAHNTQLGDFSADLKDNLNAKQLQSCTKIVERLNNNQPGIFFIDGLGGTRKTYLYRAFLAYVRSNHEISLATTTSGVAAHILTGARMAHSHFKIPIDANDGTYCNIKKQSGLADLLRATKLIVWNEPTMENRCAIEMVDRMLQDIIGIKEPFSRKVVVFGGDYRQVFPIIAKGTIQQTINVSLVKSNMWFIMEKCSLSKNMRAMSDCNFSDFLLRVGKGQEPANEKGRIKIPKEMLVKYDSDETSKQQLIDHIFPSLHKNVFSANYLSSREILSPKNEHVDQLNEKMIKQFPGEEITYTSFDEAIDDVYQYYTEEFLNSLNPNGLPPHRLVLKKNFPIMLLRNLDPSDGMFNGTRMACKSFEKNVIYAEIIEGSYAGKEVFIPRVPLYPKESEGYPFNSNENNSQYDYVLQ